MSQPIQKISSSTASSSQFIATKAALEAPRALAAQDHANAQALNRENLPEPIPTVLAFFSTLSNTMKIVDAQHILRTIFADEAVISGAFPGQGDMSRAEYAHHHKMLKESLPDLEGVCYDTATGVGGQGRHVVYARFTISGRMSNDLYGLPATHTRVEMRGMAFFRFSPTGFIEYAELGLDALDALASMGHNLYDKLPATPRSIITPAARGTAAGGGGTAAAALDALSTMGHNLYDKLPATLRSIVAPTQTTRGTATDGGGVSSVPVVVHKAE